MSCVIPLAAANQIPGARKSWHDPVLGARREPAGVVEMQMCRQNDIDLVRRQTGLCERVVEVSGAIEPVDLRSFRPQFVAHTGVDQHRLAAASYEQRPHAHQDAMAFVRLGPPAPHRPRDDAKHGAAIKTEVAVGQHRDVELTYLHVPSSPFHAPRSSQSTPPARRPRQRGG